MIGGFRVPNKVDIANDPSLVTLEGKIHISAHRYLGGILCGYWILVSVCEAISLRLLASFVGDHFANSTRDSAGCSLEGFFTDKYCRNSAR